MKRRALLFVEIMKRRRESSTKRRSHHHQQLQQQNSMRRQFRWRVPSIVLLLASCLVFVVLLTFESGNCTRLSVHSGDNPIFSGLKRAHTTNNNNFRNHKHNSIIHNDQAASPERQQQFMSEDSMVIGGGRSSSSGSSKISNELLLNSIGTSNQQVPEQASPIVVSSSDNSYVSASPIETTTTTPSSRRSSTLQKQTNGEHDPFNAGSSSRTNHNRVHRLRSQNHNQVIRANNAPSAFENNNNIKSLANLGDAGQQWNLRRRLAAQMHNRLFGTRQLEDEKAALYDSHRDHPLASYSRQQLTSSSDISTTATTTQRNKIRPPQKSRHQHSYDIVQQSVLAAGGDSLEKAKVDAQRGGQQDSESKERTNPVAGKNGDEENDDDDNNDDDDDDDDDDSDSDDYATSNLIGARRDPIPPPTIDERMQMMTPSNDNSRPSVGAHYNIKRATIIKTRESIERGATFINYTLVTNLNACLVECWITDNCDTAIYQESPVDFSNHLPYLINNNNNNNNMNNKQQQQQINHNSIEARGAHANGRAPSSSPILVSLSNLLGNKQISGPSGESGNDGGRDIVDSDENFSNEANNENSIDSHWTPSSRSRSVDDDDNGDSNNNSVDDDEDADDDEGDEESLNSENDAYAVNNNLISHRSTEPERGFFICYLFQCAKPDGFKCQFSEHNYYVSSTSGQARPFSSSPIWAAPGFPVVDRQQEAIVEFDNSRPLVKAALNDVNEPHYSNIINGGHHHFRHQPAQSHLWRPGDGPRSWHDSHVASIRIGQEEDYARNDVGGLNSAIIALMIGVCLTGMLIMIVGHKMKTIRKKIAYKGRRRSLVPDADFLISTMPI